MCAASFHLQFLDALLQCDGEDWVIQPILEFAVAGVLWHWPDDAVDHIGLPIIRPLELLKQAVEFVDKRLGDGLRFWWRYVCVACAYC